RCCCLQAEGGIRGRNVTGVQTCALPIFRVGERSKTDVCVCYLQDVANDDLVDLVKDKVREIEVDGITMADKAVEEFMLRNRWNQIGRASCREKVGGAGGTV